MSDTLAAKEVNGRSDAMVPSYRLREVSEKRRALEARLAEVERENIELKAVVKTLEGMIDRMVSEPLQPRNAQPA
jgi:hypothetical protein